MAYKDKQAQAACTKRYYEANKVEAIASAAVRKKAVVERLKAYVNELKREPCMDCKVAYPSVVMDFDHVRGEKVRDVALMVNRGCSVKTLQLEIDKCELVCSNCHRLRTWARRTSGSVAQG